MHPKTPRAPPFAQVTVETISALRSRERRFESCWGRSNAASEVIPLNCRNGNRAAVDAPPLCVTGGRLAPVFSPRGPRKIGPGSARTSLSLLPNASSLVGFACCSHWERSGRSSDAPPDWPSGGRSVASILAIHTSSQPATQRAWTRISISTLCPAHAAISVAGTPEFSRQVIPEWRRSWLSRYRLNHDYADLCVAARQDPGSHPIRAAAGVVHRVFCGCGVMWVVVNPLRVRGRPSGLKGAAHRAARDGPAGRP